MILTIFSAQGWESWDIAHRPLIPKRMPVLIDDDLRLEDGPAAPRPTVVVNRWLRELPASGAPAPSSWQSYARALKEWMEFLAQHGVELFDTRERLKLGLSRYAEHRAGGPLKARFAASTWGQHMSILSMFYRWALAEGHAQAEPFTYKTARALFAGCGAWPRMGPRTRGIGVGRWPATPRSASWRWPPGCGYKSSATCWPLRSRRCRRRLPRCRSRLRRRPG